MRAAAAAVAALALLLPAVAPATNVPASPTNEDPTAKNPTRVQVTAGEFYYALSRRVVVAGPAIVELFNIGQDPHDLRLERVGGTHVYGTPIVQPGVYYDLHVKLLPGTYELWCSIANHRALGMQAVLTVKPKRTG